MKTIRRFCLFMLAVPFFYACSAVRQCKAPELDLPAEIVPGAVDTLTMADMEWWRFYTDTTLCHIIRRTLEHNKDIRAAAARVEQMREMYRIKKAERLPTLGLDVLADHETTDYAGEKPVRDPEFGLKAEMGWEIDLWGNLRWAKRKGEAQWRASLWDERAMRMTLIAEAASAYFRLVALDNELAIVHRTLETRREGVLKAKLRFEGGLTSEVVYQQTQVEYTSTAALIPDLKNRIQLTENALCLLMGLYPGEKIRRDHAAMKAPDSRSLPIGIPSQLLRRRPDVQAAEQHLKSAMAAVGMAYADRFPRLVIKLQGGWENDGLKGFFRSPFSYVAGQLIGSIFEFGRRKARYKASLAAYDESRFNYEKKVLEAFKETDDAITSYGHVRQTTVLKTHSLNATRKYVELAALQYRAGSINYIDVLDAQRRYFDAQIAHSNAVLGEYLALIRLYKALGGGWLRDEPE